MNCNFCDHCGKHLYKHEELEWVIKAIELGIDMPLDNIKPTWLNSFQFNLCDECLDKLVSMLDEFLHQTLLDIDEYSSVSKYEPQINPETKKITWVEIKAKEINEV